MISTPQRDKQQTFCSPTGTDASSSDDHDDLASLFHSPCFQYYQPSLRNDAPSPSAHYQTLMDFVQNSQRGNEQSVPDFTLFPWNQSDNFSYFN